MCKFYSNNSIQAKRKKKKKRSFFLLILVFKFPGQLETVSNSHLNLILATLKKLCEQ